MDFDKNFSKNINFRKILNFLDSLVEKIPEQVTTLLKFVFFASLAGGAFYGISYGCQLGKNRASQSGQDLAKDTRTLFREEIEKDYNRKRKNIRMPSPEELIEDTDYKHKMEYEFHSRTAPTNSELLESDRRLLERQGLRAIRREEAKAPLYEIEDDEPESSTLQKEPIDIPNKNSFQKPPGEELIESYDGSNSRVLERREPIKAKSQLQKTIDPDEKTLPFPTDEVPSNPKTNDGQEQ
jgi:hypothetical protein